MNGQETVDPDTPLDAGAADAATVPVEALAACLEEILAPSGFDDYCPNGLQVEGDRPVRLLVSGVTASAEFIRRATAMGADALLVHHGWFWKGEDPRLRGPRRERVRLVLQAGMHLFAYHLPLDAHETLGNNVQLALRLGWRVDRREGRYGLLNLHDLPQPVNARAIGASVASALGREPLLVGELDRAVQTVAWCTGAAQDMIEAAIDAGAQLYLSGEVSERTTHAAREAGIAYVAAGHHATERYGVQALGDEVARRLGCVHRFVDDDNPV